MSMVVFVFGGGQVDHSDMSVRMMLRYCAVAWPTVQRSSGAVGDDTSRYQMGSVGRKLNRSVDKEGKHAGLGKLGEIAVSR